MKTVQTETVSIEELKQIIKANINKQILIKEYNKQGKLLKKTEGVIVDAYNSVFLVKVNIRENFLNKSYSYIDFLTKELVYEILN